MLLKISIARICVVLHNCETAALQKISNRRQKNISEKLETESQN